MYRQIKSIFKCLKKAAKWSYVKIICHFRRSGMQDDVSVKEEAKLILKKTQKYSCFIRPENMCFSCKSLEAGRWFRAGRRLCPWSSSRDPNFSIMLWGVVLFVLSKAGPLASVCSPTGVGGLSGFPAGNCDLEVDALKLLQGSPRKRLSLVGFSGAHLEGQAF